MRPPARIGVKVLSPSHTSGCPWLKNRIELKGQNFSEIIFHNKSPSFQQKIDESSLVILSKAQNWKLKNFVSSINSKIGNCDFQNFFWTYAILSAIILEISHNCKGIFRRISECFLGFDEVSGWLLTPETKPWQLGPILTNRLKTLTSSRFAHFRHS